MATPMTPAPTAPRTSRRVYLAMVLLSLLLLLLPSPCLAKAKRAPFTAFQMPPEDPYKVLGVSRRATLTAIKKAYRKKAKDAHPDKNPDLDPTVANDKFRRIVQAFEFLSDPSNKRTYDQRRTQKNRMTTQGMFTRTQTQQKSGYTSYTFTTSNSKGSQNQQQQQQQGKQKQDPHTKRFQILREAKLAQDKVLKLSTLDKLKETLLDRHGRFTKHFLCVFVAGKRVEHFVTDDLLFPYPFTGNVAKGSSQKQQKEWESILQSAKVRYNGPTPLTAAFRVPSVESAHRTEKPYVVFARKGDRIDQFHVYRPKSWMPHGHAKLEDWVRKQLTSQLTIVNYHHAPVQIFTMDGKSTSDEEDNNLKVYEKPIPPGHQMTLQAHTADRILVMDANVDKFPGSTGWDSKSKLLRQEEKLQRVLLDDILVTSTEPEEIEIGAGYGTTRRCYDLSLECHSWATQARRKGQLPHCEAQIEFAHTMCAKTCGVCVDAPWNGVYYTLFHCPLHKIPTPVLRGGLSALRSVATFMDVFFDDFIHLWSMRRNVTVGFLVAGLLGGIQVVIFGHMLFASNASTTNTNWHLELQQAGALLFLVVSLACWGIWMSLVSPSEVPPIMRGFQKDLVHMVRQSMDAIYALLYLGFLSWIVASKLAQRTRSRSTPTGPRNGRSNLPMFLFLLAMVSSLMLLGATYLIQNDNILVNGTKNHRSIRWTQIWKLHKNVALSIFGVGCLVGAFTLAAKQFIWQSPDKKYVGLSLINVSLFVFGASLAYQDRYFAKDLDHVLHMRMSAAIPCAVLGMMWGITFAHFLSTYQVKVKVD